MEFLGGIRRFFKESSLSVAVQSGNNVKARELATKMGFHSQRVKDIEVLALLQAFDFNLIHGHKEYAAYDQELARGLVGSERLDLLNRTRSILPYGSVTIKHGSYTPRR